MQATLQTPNLSLCARITPTLQHEQDEDKEAWTIWQNLNH